MPSPGRRLFIAPTSAYRGVFTVDGVQLTADAGSTFSSGAAIAVDGVEIGTALQHGNKCSLEIVFGAAATEARLTTLLRGLTFRSDEIGTHQFTLRLFDGLLQSNKVEFSVEVTAALTTVIEAIPGFDAGSGLFSSTVTVTNPHAETVAGFILRIGNLPADVQVYNATGRDGDTPVIVWRQPLAPSESVQLVVQYYRASLDLDFSPSYAAEFILLPSQPASSSTFRMEGLSREEDGGFTINWLSVPGHTYAIENSSDLSDWDRVGGTPTAASNRMTWTDRGAPETKSHPSAQNTRFYRIIQINP